MAMPGRPLLTLYDPTALRVTAALPESAAPRESKQVGLEIPGSGSVSGSVSGSPVLRNPASMQVLPAVDPATHTVTVRFDLADDRSGSGHAPLAPGMFARVWLTGDARADATHSEIGRARVPFSSVVRRAELSGIYVVDAQGKPRLRQVRLGRLDHANVEVLSGLNPGDRIALDPQAAARVR
jgi:hypothetical protein